MSIIAVAAVAAVLGQAPGAGSGTPSSAPSVHVDRPLRAQPSSNPARVSSTPRSGSSSDAESEDDFNPFAKRGYRIRSVIAGSLGGAFLLTGGTLYALTWVEQAKLETPGAFATRNEVLASLEHGRRMQLASVITTGAGLAFSVGAVAMYFIDHKRDAAKGVQLTTTGNGFALTGTLP